MQPKNLHIVPPLTTHTHTIILLHGRDSTASEFASELFESQATSFLTLPALFPTFNWILPQSKLRDSARFGTALSQWFDVWSVEEPDERAEAQLDDGLNFCGSSAGRKFRRSASFWGGISQGRATAVLSLLCSGVRVGAFVGVCGWLPLRKDIEGFLRYFETISDATSKI